MFGTQNVDADRFNHSRHEDNCQCFPKFIDVTSVKQIACHKLEIKVHTTDASVATREIRQHKDLKVIIDAKTTNGTRRNLLTLVPRFTGAIGSRWGQLATLAALTTPLMTSTLMSLSPPRVSNSTPSILLTRSR